MTDESATQTFDTKFDLADILKPPVVNGNLPDFHIALVYRAFDFDDLWEFASSPDQTATGSSIFFSDHLFADAGAKENHRILVKSFNGEYYFSTERFVNHIAPKMSAKWPDGYPLKVFSVYLSPEAHPPQSVSGC